MNVSETENEQPNITETHETNKTNEKNDISDNEAPKVIEVDRQMLLNLKTIFNIVSQRGVFKASEMSAVGKIYNDLSSLLE